MGKSSFLLKICLLLFTSQSNYLLFLQFSGMVINYQLCLLNLQVQILIFAKSNLNSNIYSGAYSCSYPQVSNVKERHSLSKIKSVVQFINSVTWSLEKRRIIKLVIAELQFVSRPLAPTATNTCQYLKQHLEFYFIT